MDPRIKGKFRERGCRHEILCAPKVSESAGNMTLLEESITVVMTFLRTSYRIPHGGMHCAQRWTTPDDPTV